MDILAPFVHYLCHLPVRERIAEVPADATQNNLSALVVSPLERVGFGHCDGCKRMQSPTITSADERFCNTTAVNPGLTIISVAVNPGSKIS